MSVIRIPVILDTDIGFDIDDTWALGLLLNCPELDVRLITTTSGNTIIKAKLVAKFLEIAGRTDIPIGIGIKQNDTKGYLYPWIKNYEINNYSGQVFEQGIEFICDTILESPDPISIIAIGPLGNIAKAIKHNPKILNNARFIGMQGSIKIGYRGSPTPVPEHNVFSNIQACRDVFQASWDKIITPLDTCGNVILTGKNYEQILNCNNPIVNSIKACYKIWIKEREIPATFYNNSSILYDTVAIYLAFSEELLNIVNLKIKITKDGITELNENGEIIRCATSWKDLKAFKQLIIERLTNKVNTSKKLVK